MLDKIGRYEFLAEPFHCDFRKELFMGHLGNHLLNAADFHSAERGMGMTYLNPIHKTWVLSRLAIEMTNMPKQYSRFYVDTWVESAIRYFTNRNFRVVDAAGSGEVYGYGRSIWAMIDTDTRQPQNIMEIGNGVIIDYVDQETPCPIGKLSRVQMGPGAKLVSSIETHYSDIDVNGHVNSVKYIEHVLDLFSVDFYKSHAIRRIDIAYVAESYYGDKLSLYLEKLSETGFCVRICRKHGEREEEAEAEACRCKVEFVKV